MCREPMAAIQGVCDFLKIPMTEQCQDYITGQLQAAKLSQYKNEDPAKIKAVEEAINSTLKRYQYL